MNDKNEFQWPGAGTTFLMGDGMSPMVVYKNPDGSIVVRQKDPLGGDDVVIVLSKTEAKDLINKLEKPNTEMLKKEQQAESIARLVISRAKK